MKRCCLAIVFATLLGGCVERKMTVTSEPSGALVYMNDREVGRTPFTRDFIWYGKYDVQVRKDGYETLSVGTNVTAPWWQIPPIDLAAELMPWHPTDRRELHYTLKPTTQRDVDPAALVDRGDALRATLEGSRAAVK